MFMDFNFFNLKFFGVLLLILFGMFFGVYICCYFRDKQFLYMLFLMFGNFFLYFRFCVVNLFRIFQMEMCEVEWFFCFNKFFEFFCIKKIFFSQIYIFRRLRKLVCFNLLMYMINFINIYNLFILDIKLCFFSKYLLVYILEMIIRKGFYLKL